MQTQEKENSAQLTSCLLYTSTVEKQFARFDEQQTLNFQRLAQEVPYEYMHMTNEIVAYAQISLNKELNEEIYISLMDHLNFAINRTKPVSYTHLAQCHISDIRQKSHHKTLSLLHWVLHQIHLDKSWSMQ